MNLAELIEEGKRLESKQNSVVALPLQWATHHRRERRFRQEYDLRGPFERAAAKGGAS